MPDIGPALVFPRPGDGARLSDLLRKMGSSSRVDLTGARGSALAAALAGVSAGVGHGMVVVVEAGATTMHANLCYHLGVGIDSDEVILYPSHDMGPYDELVPDRRSTLRRASALFRLSTGSPWKFLVVEAQTLLRKTVPRKVFEDSCAPIAVGDRIDRETLVETLERGGYSRAPLVEEPGTYALRGAVVDVFVPYMDRPARIEMFGNDVERMRFFDQVTQASGDPIDEIWVHPARLVMTSLDGADRELICTRLRAVCDEVEQPTTKTDRLIEDLVGGRLFVGAHGFEPAFFDEMGSLFDFIPTDAGFCLDNPVGVMMAWAKAARTWRGEYERRIEKREPSFPPECHILETGGVEEFVYQRRLVVLSHRMVADGEAPGSLEAAEDPVDLNSMATSDTGERLRHLSPAGGSNDLVGPLASHLSTLAGEGYRVVIVAHTAGQADRLATMLRGRDLHVEMLDGSPERRKPGVHVSTGDLMEGCILPGEALAWITEEEVFGKRARRRRGARRPSANMEDLRALVPGDLVVHSEHGVGRYEGLHRQQVRNSLVDFLHIVYRDGDKLLLPVYRLNQVQKYRSVGDGVARLDKLGGQTFAKTRASASKHAMEMAAKLLDLYARREISQRPALDSPDDLFREFEASFPFEETDDQERAIDEVMADLGGHRPMDRLICGDVGFGKTEVAMRAAFRVTMSGRQVAVLVPTTVLAQQHYQSFSRRLAPYPVRVEVMSRFRSASQNAGTAAGLKDGSVDVVIGTHRLLSADVHFKRLGLLVIDEEHRFGVSHKERIRSLRASVDTLVLTATPIPRTLHMSFAGLRDLTLIGTAPVDRRPIKTIACHDDPRIIAKAMERELARQGQVFYVHNRVKDIGRVAQRVREMMPEARVAVGHGQMKEEDLERVMMDFVEGRYDILVCTAIIESGLDIPRANTIIIDRADTFGLAQLYQIRGRVGRSHLQAYAYLIVPPLNIIGEDARERVEALTRYTDLGSGFSVATLDLEIRGAGDLLGAQQSGDVAGVGFEMYCELLEEASAQLRGVTRDLELEPEMTFENPGFLPDEYIPDVGLRLQYYKRLASAQGEEGTQSAAAEMVDRFGPLPREAEELVRGMTAKALCRDLRVAGLEAGSRRLVVHLGHDSRVDPDRALEIVREADGAVRLTRDLKLVVKVAPGQSGDADGAIRFLRRLGAYEIKTA